MPRPKQSEPFIQELAKLVEKLEEEVALLKNQIKSMGDNTVGEVNPVEENRSKKVNSICGV